MSYRGDLRNFGCSLVICAAAMVSSFYSAQAGMPAILSDKDDVKDIIDSFRAQMSELIKQAGDETRVTLVRAFQLSETLIGALSTTYDQSLHKTFGELDAQQQKTFQDAHKLRLIPLSQVHQYLGLADRIRNGAGFDSFGRS
jgi:hypothetical protein